MKNNAAKWILALALLSAPPLVAGCAGLGDVRVADAGSGGSPSSSTDVGTFDAVFPMVDNGYPEEYEVKTIQIDSTVGLYYIAPGTDVSSELELMGATVIDHGPLYDAIEGEG